MIPIFTNNSEWSGLSAIAGGLIPPSGYVFLLDTDGAYLTDTDGHYLIEAI